jgi:hypothetical protein
VFAKEDEHTYNGAILRIPPDSEFLHRAIDYCTQARDNVALESTVATGPALVNRLIRELGLEKYSWAREDMYPLRWDEGLRFFDPSEADRIEALAASATFVHLWTGMLRTGNVLKDVGPPESSYLDRMYRAYDVDFPRSPRYTWPDMKPQYEFQKERWSLGESVDAICKDRDGAIAEAARVQQQLGDLTDQNRALRHELQLAREQISVLQNMKVMRWSAPVRRLVYRLRARRR